MGDLIRINRKWFYYNLGILKAITYDRLRFYLTRSHPVKRLDGLVVNEGVRFRIKSFDYFGKITIYGVELDSNERRD